ncbi:type I-G CRISPR-associated RAMP protein Csb1/Cas7g [Tessaracoccus palaemonis]|uniref:Type I-U CRISPR-associated protein Cas7 n=1 Tax=Tessaracoccus palaemonis TaxID=2829499 RepID=A0ABX8SII1_9ACTN|nr:type I-U CRISPR-associated RAMP protein Csb1/Cas7u [Tessaracoccus palaemonis]QXT63098.1 type I-U CRISPR-associated protein Cas7 [Tessaracoccus palaemonis]
MAQLTLDSLSAKLKGGDFALVRINTTYQPAGGPGAKVFPPTFPLTREESSPYLLEERISNGAIRKAAVLDQVPSQANRGEEAVAAAQGAGLVKVPMLRLTHDGAEHAVITSFTAPHRVFDAYWRDSLIDGEKFDKTAMGKALQAASLADARAVLEHDPGSLTFGSWNSHRKGRQAKFPRVYQSEIVGWDPVVGSRKAGRMDPLNLVGSRSGEGDEWSYSSASQKTAKGKLSEIGHGNIAPNEAHGGVTISGATRFATLSLAGLRRIAFGSATAEQGTAARAYLAAFALLADRLALGGASVWLRSGCELVVEEETLEWVGRGGVVEQFSLTQDEAIALYREALDAAVAAGVALALEPVELTPSSALSKAIDFSLTKAESAGE